MFKDTGRVFKKIVDPRAEWAGGLLSVVCLGCVFVSGVAKSQEASAIGREVAIPRHMQDGEEFNTPIPRLIRYGKQLFEARFTSQKVPGVH